MSSWLVRRAAVAARLAITFGAAWLVARTIDWTALLILIARADPTRLLLAGITLAVQFAIMVWRWRRIIGLLGGGSVPRAALAIGLGRSMLIGQPLPSTIGGDVARILLLASETGLTIAARSVICDRLVALAALIALVIALLPLFAIFVDNGPTFIVVGAASVGVGAALVLVVAQAKRLASIPWFQHFGTIAEDIRPMFTHGRDSFAILGLSLATHLLGVLLVYELARAIAAPVSLFQCLLIVPPTLLISAIPISVGGWGIREGALAVGFAMIGATHEQGVATSLFFGLTGPLIGIIAELAAPFVKGGKSSSKDKV